MKYIGIGLLFLLAVTALLFSPKSAVVSYKVASGLMFKGELERRGISISYLKDNPTFRSSAEFKEIRNICKQKGIIYSALSICGFILPLHILLFQFVIYTFNFSPNSKMVNRATLFVLIVILGVCSLTTAQFSLFKDIQSAYQGAISMWIIIVTCLFILYIPVKCIKVIKIRKSVRTMNQ